MLRALTEKQKAELAAKDKTIEGQKSQIGNQKAQIKKQRMQIENMVQALLHARKKLFGPSSEITGQAEGQINLFENTMGLVKELFKEQKKITVPSYTRTARRPGVRAEMLAGLPKDIEEFIINPEETCSVCNSELKIIGKKLVRTEVEYIPAKLKVKQIIQQVAKCIKCGADKSLKRRLMNSLPSAPLEPVISFPLLVSGMLSMKYLRTCAQQRFLLM